MILEIIEIFRDKSLFKDEPCIYYNKRQFIKSYFSGFLTFVVCVILIYLLYTESRDAIQH